MGEKGVWELGQGHLLILPLPQEAPPPLTPPQPASPTEDKMPPYDEQTQALIDGECSLGLEGGDLAYTCPPLPLPVGTQEPGLEGYLGPGEASTTPASPKGPSASSLAAVCLCHVHGWGGSDAAGALALIPWEPRPWAVGWDLQLARLTEFLGAVLPRAGLGGREADVTSHPFPSS